MLLEEIEYKGLSALKLSNDICEIIVPTCLGIRVLSYNLKGQKNIFKNFDLELENKNLNKWQSFGGHRLWHCPEARPRTYEIDGKDISYTFENNILTLMQKTDEFSRINKKVEIVMEENSSKVKVIHKITNENAFDINTAGWALSVLDKGGFTSVETPQNDFSLLSDRTITLWPYTRLNDARLYFGDKIISLKQDANVNNPCKIGFFAQKGKAIYVLDKLVFKKSFNANSNDSYPDHNCNFESYTNSEMLECESLSKNVTLKYNESLEFTENWELINIKNEIAFNDEAKILELLK